MDRSRDDRDDLDHRPQPASVEDGGGSVLGAEFSRRRAWGAVLLLSLIGVVNVVDRILPGLLVEPIKHDLGLSDTAIGLINGVGFLVVYSLIGLPLARIADRGAYGLVISGCLALWSFMTFIGAAAQTGWQFAITRIGVAVGEAGNTPAAHAFIARNFPPTRRGAPLALLTLSVPVSVLIGTIGGGLVGEALGWRATFVIMGVVGLVLSPVVLLVLGPQQGTAHGLPRQSLSLRPAFLLLRKPSFLLILAGTSCIGAGGYTMVAFSAAFLMRVHKLSLGEVGMRYGIAAGAAGLVSVVISGLAVDRLAKRDTRWILGVVVAMIALLLPFAYAAFLVSNPWLALAFMALGNVIGGAYLAPVVAAIQRLAPIDLRATASAIMLLAGSVVGSLGPLVTGMISDALQPTLGAQALGRAMLLMPVAYTFAGLLFAAATVTFRRDLVEEATSD